MPKCIYALLRIFNENNQKYDPYIIDNNPGKLPLYMSIGMGRCYKYIRYQLAWIIVYSVNLNKKLIAYCLRPLWSVSSPVLAKYRSKWAPVAMVSTSSANPQNCKRFSLLPSSSCCENGETKTRTCLNYFIWAVSDILRKIFKKSNNGSKLNFEVALNA